MKKNKLGNRSLAIAVICMAGCLTLKYFKIYNGDWLEILLAGFEAAVVGGVADWFAVRALFQEIPIPIVKKHTNIIVKSREKLSAGIVDLVNNEWLSKDMIRDKISAVSIAKPIVSYLLEDNNQESIRKTLKPELEALILKLDHQDVVHTLEGIIRPAVKGNNLAEPLGNLLKQTVNQKDHYGMLYVFLEVLKDKISAESTLDFLVAEVKILVNKQKEGSQLKGWLVGAGQILGAIKPQRIAEGIQEQLVQLIDDIKADPEEHKIIIALDAQLYDYATRLTNGDEKAQADVNQFGEHFLERLIDSGIVKQSLTRLKDMIKTSLFENENEYTLLIRDKVNMMLHAFNEDTSKIEQTDAWLKSTILQLIDTHHHKIGELVGESLQKLSNVELVKQIESKVGEDLQYIRLNGAIVGGIVGMLIMIVKIYVLRIH
ncbi:DUF445 domain-containing protein [Formosa algae]|uniref:Uncharacterized membrane-anchored protein YjiN (DUF445 family) n=1 Tax=Formosa algae TaxID=225843 RepID=A0A9X1C8P3_9FLAO|nr:DUF445 domain-containing protein [Formosa algae]MBP1838803.1 uncharacterized membrane-anchored protein YjiN (DUF445 family) [Formosa algae]MDQ0333580.1 uncharacterized membrane-anchored protein YjiN (DUF445 family) [Formosa algae]OEI80282.1 hypothetical protein AST99_10240 [Formosa algae]